MEQFKKIVAENLSAMRKEHHLTQLQLAELLHYSDKAVSKWERGESLPDLIVLKQIADLYHVTLDDLVSSPEERAARNIPQETELTEEPDAPPQTFLIRDEKIHNRNRRVITTLASLLVWFIATLAFVILDTFAPDIRFTPLMFLYALPLTAIVVLVFNSLWFNKRANYLIISVLMWSSLATIYLSFLRYNPWKIFLVGVPAQIIIIVWSCLKPSKKEIPNTDETIADA